MATTPIISDKNNSRDELGIIDSKLVAAIEVLDEVLSDASSQRQGAIRHLHDLISKHIDDINIIDCALAQLPPTYDELMRLQRQRRNEKQSATNSEENSDHALNFHLNRISHANKDNIFVPPDHFDDGLSVDSSSYSLTFDNPDEIDNSMTSVVKSTTHDKVDGFSLCEKFIDQSKELQEIEHNLQEELNALKKDDSIAAAEKRLFLTKSLQRHEINRVKTLKNMIFSYKPKLNHIKNLKCPKSSINDIFRDIQQVVKG